MFKQELTKNHYGYEVYGCVIDGSHMSVDDLNTSIVRLGVALGYELGDGFDWSCCSEHLLYESDSVIEWLNDCDEMGVWYPHESCLYRDDPESDGGEWA